MMYDFESSYNKLREIAGLNFVSFQMLDNLALSDVTFVISSESLK